MDRLQPLIIGVAIGILMLSSLVGAGAEPVTIKYYTLAWQPGVVQAIRSTIAQWNETHPDVQVEIVWGSWAAANEFLLTSFLGGDAPDIFHQDAVMCYEYGVLGFAEPLNAYLNEETMDAIPRWLWESGSNYDGTIYGWPFLVETHAVFYNRDLFAASNIDVPDNAEITWGQLVDFAARLTKRDATGDVATWGVMASVMEKFPWMLVRQNDGHIVNRSDDGTWYVEVDDAAREALAYYCDLVTTREVMAPEAISSDYTYLMSGFSQERYAMIIFGCWNRRILVQWDNVNWGILHLQGPVNNISSGGPQSHGIWAGSDHKSEAAMFLQYLTDPENIVEIAYPDWIFPARTDAQTDTRFTQEEYEWDLASSWLSYAADVLPRMPTIIAFDMRIVVPELEQVMLGRKNLDDAIAAIEKKGNDYLRQTGLQ